MGCGVVFVGEDWLVQYLLCEVGVCVWQQFGVGDLVYWVVCECVVYD